MTDRFDYIIVGAGTAGCVLANRLSADGRHRVCILEAGGRDWNPMLHIPAGFMKTLVDPSVNWLYKTEPSPWTAGRSILAARGKTLGGSSAINGHIYNRGQRLDFDGWAQRGNRGWGYADVLPYFRRSERRVGDADDTYRGRDGGIVVTDPDWRHPLCEAFIEGAVSIGIPRNPDYNGAFQDGVGYFQRAIHNGRRVSAARAFLHPAAGRANLTIRTHAHATKILMEGRRAVGIRYLAGGRGGSEVELHADKEVILAGGVVNSPQLLQVSGIGPAGLLGRLGIPVVQALPGVGENLRDHYAPRMVGRVRGIDTINERARGIRLVGEIAKWMVARKGILGLSPTVVHCFWKSHEALQTNDLQMTFTPASYKEGVQSRLDDFPGMTVAAWQQRPESSGWVRARSADPLAPPEIQPNYLAHEMDRRVLLGGIKLGRRLLRTAPLAPYFEREEYPGDQAQTDDELLDFARQRGTTTFHLMGTCRMGPGTDPTTVVDDQLRVHGLDGLRVVDASIMPTMPSANLNASTLMIGEKGADLILGRAPPEPVPLAD
ncbi:GMC family oxidoreductase [Stella sp.]|uniref:GMC family oxidoreductase n=1 Tax=Stella sp. TaxID=2912054 RepID=UPI0035B140C8